MYNAGDSIPTLSDDDYEYMRTISGDAEVRNCILIANARPFVFGGHATRSTNPRCLIEDIYVHDCEIMATPGGLFITTPELASYWRGFMRLLSQSEQIVRNITFENIIFNVTKGYLGKLIHIDVRSEKEASYSESKGYRIENITVNNFDLNGKYLRCSISNEGNDSIYKYTFNTYVDSKKITKDN